MAFFSRKPKTIPEPLRSQPPRAARPEGVPSPAASEPRILEIGADLLARARGHKAGLLSAQFYSDWLMEWSMKDPGFKVQMFRFVDAFPTLRTADAVFDHLTDYMSQPGVKVPTAIAAALRAGALAKSLAAPLVSRQITGMASKFIAGTDAASALPGLRRLWDDGIGFSVDLLGEVCVSDAEADSYRDKYLDLISNLPAQVASWKAQPRLESDHLGPIPRTNVSIKISALSARCDPIDTAGSIKDLMRRLVPLLETARDRGVFINFDMEHHALKDLTIELFMRCAERVDFQGGLAMQAYLRSGVEDARRVCDWATRAGRLVTVRLVKGAYWDAETIKAEQSGWPNPVWRHKWQTDACFERMAEVFLDACPPASSSRLSTGASGTGVPPVSTPPTSSPSRSSPGIRLALGSHNARSIAAALAAAEARGLPHSAIEFQMLHGMADQLKHAAVEMGLRVREYVPVGEMIPGMAYLVRRLLENTSNESWLKAGFLDNADADTLLRDPAANGRTARAGGDRSSTDDASRLHSSNGTAPRAVPAPPATPADVDADPLAAAPERHALSPSHAGVGDGRPFFNEPMRDFSRADARASFAVAIAKAAVPPVPSDRTPEQAAQMVARAEAAFPAWRDADPLLRCRVLIDAAGRMRARRDELAGVMIKESGKTWREADADVCEAIDFCEFYARLAAPMFERRRLGRFLGELDETWYQPRGVAVVISPWNFPLAICCGMTVAALVTGNTVVLKPAEQTTGIAKIMVDLLHQSIGAAMGRGAVNPADVLHFCPAPGETTGAALVRDPRIAIIAFTGSRDVGLDILNAAAPPSPFSKPIQDPTRSVGVPKAEGATRSVSSPKSLDPSLPRSLLHIKRVICEMGGKNAVIVDTSADLDEAVLGVRHSAFGFQGQKCSACSRVVVVDPAGPSGPAIRGFVRRFVEATRSLTIGDPLLPGTDVGPVIDAEAKQKILSYIETARREGDTLELATPVPPGLEAGSATTDRDQGSAGQPGGSKHYVGPHIFSGVRPEHTIAREEIFGPVVAVMHAASFEDALAIANDSPYRLTGGVFSRKPAHLELAKQKFRVGNLYLNRGITGALVARQPFGGFGMSGVGSKAGGVDYLLQFVEPRASCENTMRRGFAPEME